MSFFGFPIDVYWVFTFSKFGIVRLGLVWRKLRQCSVSWEIKVGYLVDDDVDDEL